MSHYNTLFSSLLSQIPRHQFETIAKNYGSGRYAKKLSAWNQLTVLLYAQAGGLESLREIEQASLVQALRLYHWGLPDKICRNTLSHANAVRSWQVYQGLFYKLLSRCKDFTPRHKFKFNNPLYSIDATTISLCLSMFPWAKIKHKKGAIKLHYKLDHAGDIPDFLIVSKGDASDIRVAKAQFALLRDSIYCFDRGYVDAAWFAKIQQAGAYFVTRLREGTKYRVVGQHAGFHPTARILNDEVIALAGTRSKQRYSHWMRLIRYYDKSSDRVFEFITNHLTLPAATVADIYKSRWQIEAFFKWIKQNLKIKTFLGTTENAVLTQIWAAMCYYLLLAYIKYQSRYVHSLYYLHRMIRAGLMEKFTVVDILRLNERRFARARDDDMQLFLPFA